MVDYLLHMANKNWENSKGYELLNSLKKASESKNVILGRCVNLDSQLVKEMKKETYLNSKEVLEEARMYLNNAFVESILN
jgi:hypothetical protein